MGDGFCLAEKLYARCALQRLHLIGRGVQIIAVLQLDQTAVAGGSQVRIHGQLAQPLQAVLFGDLETCIRDSL